MTRPQRARSMPFDARLTTRNAPPRFVATTLSKSSSRHAQQQRVLRDAGVGDDDLDRAELSSRPR